MGGWRVRLSVLAPHPDGWSPALGTAAAHVSPVGRADPFPISVRSFAIQFFEMSPSDVGALDSLWFRLL